MGADTASIVAGAVKDAEEGIVPDSEPTDMSGSGERTVVDIGGVEEGEESGTPAKESVASPSSAAAAGETKTKDLGTAVAKTTPPPAAQKPDDELTKEMARHGIHAPEPGKREGVFRWSKVQKVVENVRAKAAAQFEPQIKERDTRITALSKQLEDVSNADRMIFHDPDRYIATLAAMHPEKYGKFAKVLNGGAAEPEAKTTPPPAAADDPMPEPDAQFPDGSLGYSMEGQQKREEWLQRRIVADVTTKVEKMYADRFGPIEKDWKQRQMDQAAADRREKNRPGVHAQIATVKKLWGPLFKAKLAGDAEDDPEILKAMDDHPDWSFEACVSSVLLPKMQAERETMRKGLIDEIKQAPLAAAKTTPGSGGGGGGKSGPRVTADIVAEAVRAATGR